MSDVISPPRSKQKPVYVSLNYLVNMTMDSNLIPAAERTLLVLQITNQAAAAGWNVVFEGFFFFFGKENQRLLGRRGGGDQGRGAQRD